MVILNGVGSVGKSATARALQETVAAPFLHVATDAVLEMLISRMFPHPDGMIFEIVENGPPSVSIALGRFVEQVLRGMGHAVAAMADQGNDVIVDEVMPIREDAEYRWLLSGHEVYLFNAEGHWRTDR